MNTKPSTSIPMSSPDLTDAERQAVAAVLRTPNLSMGPNIAAFEEDFAAYTGVAHAIAVSSGTNGLHLCIRAADIRAGDMVITTPFSFVASANVILYERAVPIFVDVDPKSGNIDPEQVREAAYDLVRGDTASAKWLPRQGAASGSRLRAILPVHVFGQPADMDPIMEIAADLDLCVIEDACEALGSSYQDRPAGSLGHHSVFAFYPNKQITTGEGAVVLTEEEEAANLMRALRNQGRAPGDTWLQHTHLGYNYRLDEMSAALGRVQLQRIDELLLKRSRVAAWYQERLRDISAVEPPFVPPTTTRTSWFVYVVRFAPEVNRDHVAEALKSYGVPSRPYFIPIHLQPYMRSRFDYRPGDFPITERLGDQGLALPFSSVMTEAQVTHVCQALEAVLK